MPKLTIVANIHANPDRSISSRGTGSRARYGKIT